MHPHQKHVCHPGDVSDDNTLHMHAGWVCGGGTFYNHINSLVETT